MSSHLAQIELDLLRLYPGCDVNPGYLALTYSPIVK